MGDEVRGRRVVAAVVAAVLLCASGAAASEVSGPRFGELARRAASGDADALRELRDVRSVDGRPTDVESALAGATGEDLRERLLVLSDVAPAPQGSVGSGRAGETARDILSRPPYVERELPRPFRGVLEWLGDRLQPVFEPVRRAASAVLEAVVNAFGAVAGVVPGGEATLLALLGAAVVAVAALWTARTLDRRASAVQARMRRLVERGTDPAKLEREADEAERRGDWRTAIRLRFAAGLLRLDAAGVLAYRPSLTTGEVSRALRLRTFRPVARTFDEVVYGERPPDSRDAEVVRVGLGRVLEEVSVR